MEWRGEAAAGGGERRVRGEEMAMAEIVLLLSVPPGLCDPNRVLPELDFWIREEMLDCAVMLNGKHLSRLQEGGESRTASAPPVLFSLSFVLAVHPN